MSTAFCAEDVIEHFQKALADGSDVNLREYVAAYREINKWCWLFYFYLFFFKLIYDLSGFSWVFVCRLFLLLGKIFSFVETDVQEKELILDRYCDEDSEHYATVDSMTDWETIDEIPPKRQVFY